MSIAECTKILSHPPKKNQERILLADYHRLHQLRLRAGALGKSRLEKMLMKKAKRIKERLQFAGAFGEQS